MKLNSAKNVNTRLVLERYRVILVSCILNLKRKLNFKSKEKEANDIKIDIDVNAIPKLKEDSII